MAKLKEVAHPQIVVNVLANLLNDAKGLRELDINAVPVLRNRTRLERLPFCQIYVVQRDQEEFASPNRYINRLMIEIDVVTALDETFSEERRLHFYEEIIEDIIIKNVQIPSLESSLPDNMSWQMMKFMGCDYDSDIGDENALDEMVITVEVTYVRTVV